ncbi:carbonic anhydrase 2-like isoform X4 [Xyrauchen texanus]|uniref:carbonic anhydrase 2-like isoform X4 n=1 Tax=Xyrauchen texanus TaxID=154827 RepID=UPI0022425C05|nr:carbonic anhydrase 2-like isoform X4 [Xyrauchen texanus]
MIVLLVTCLAAILCPTAHSAESTVEWCYHEPACNVTKWPNIVSQFCNGSRQSPIDIVTANVQANPKLTTFNFTGFGDNATFMSIINSGHSVVVNLDHTKMAVEGGDLPGLYNSVNFHLHWGNGSSGPGSEHTVDGKQYPMELHIVNVHSKYNRSVKAALDANDATGLAVLGFFIEGTNDTSKTKSWEILTSYLSNITNAGQATSDIMHQITMDSLLENVNRTKYYRYQGSLTTPSCNEVVIWTVFKDTIKVSHELISLFRSTVHFHGTSPQMLITNNFRGVQSLNSRVVTSQVAGTVTAGTVTAGTVTAGTVTAGTLTSLYITTIFLFCSLWL